MSLPAMRAHMLRAALLSGATPRTSSAATVNPTTTPDPSPGWEFAPGSLLLSSPRSSTPSYRTMRSLRNCSPTPLHCLPFLQWSSIHRHPRPRLLSPVAAGELFWILWNLWKWRRTKPLSQREGWSMRKRKVERLWDSWPALVWATCQQRKPLTCSCHCWRREAAYDTILACRLVCDWIVVYVSLYWWLNMILCVFRWTVVTALPQRARPALSMDSAQTAMAKSPSVQIWQKKLFKPLDTPKSR